MKFAACIFVVCTLAFTIAERCETPCTREYRPVCGTDGASYRTFPNPCVLRNQHCVDGHTWVQTRAEDCPNVEFEEDLPCEVPCTREYAPVCGTDGQSFRVFPTSCVLRNQHCKDGHDWFQTRNEDCPNFELNEERPCEVPCTREFRPVCGTDGESFKRFPNACVLRNQHCRDGHNWYETRLESCVENDEDEVSFKNCSRICPAIYAPVCGFDGQVYKKFASKCMLTSNNCLFNNNWAIVSLNKCA